MARGPVSKSEYSAPASTRPPPPGLTGTEQLANGRCYSEEDNENKARSTAGLTFATPTSHCY